VGRFSLRFNIQGHRIFLPDLQGQQGAGCEPDREEKDCFPASEWSGYSVNAWILIWIFASEESRSRLTEEVKHSIGGLSSQTDE
jgi:hypothetical protein